MQQDLKTYLKYYSCVPENLGKWASIRFKTSFYKIKGYENKVEIRTVLWYFKALNTTLKIFHIMDFVPACFFLVRNMW